MSTPVITANDQGPIALVEALPKHGAYTCDNGRCIWVAELQVTTDGDKTQICVSHWPGLKARLSDQGRKIVYKDEAALKIVAPGQTSYIV